jgi:hypothetical protein
VPNTVRVGWGGFAGCAAVALLATALWHEWIVVPDRWNPWAPLWPQEAPTFVTTWKLARIARDPAACAATLAATTLTYAPQPDRAVGNGCGWRDAVRVSGLPARLGAPVVLTCPAALSLAMWERHTLQPAAIELWGRRVVAIDHFGTYSCRDIGAAAPTASEGDGGEGQTRGGRRSEHASANAIDVAGFTLADGTAIGVERDWGRPADDRRARFLRRTHDGACRWWHVVLGPGYNAAHRNHFHLDRGASRACR